MKLRMLFLILAVVGSSLLPAQDRLVMHISHLSGRTSRVEFREGDDFRFRIKNNPHRYTCTIIGICDSVVYFKDQFSVELRDLDKIYVDQSNFLTRKFSRFFLALGIGYPLLNAVNNAAGGLDPMPDKPTLVVCGTLAVSGIVMKLAFLHRYRVGKRCTLWIIG
ncbi:MAG: hypothetical protein ACHQRM_15410 [Bacteroidia bacterium]